MGSTLGVLFAQAYMAAVEEKVLATNEPHVYARYVDDIYVDIEDAGALQNLQRRLEGESGLKFTLEQSVNNRINFLDVSVDASGPQTKTTVYRKPTDDGKCLHGRSACPQRYRESVIRAYVHRALKYCSSWEAVNQEVKRVKQMLTNNGYPISMIDDITRQTISKHFSQTEDNDPSTSDKTHRLYFKNQMSPAYKADENALKTIIHRNCKPAQQNDKLELRIYYISPKTSSLIMTNNITRDKAPLSQTNVVYQFKCNKEECALLPGSTYIGKTVDTLNHRLQNHKYKGAPEQHTEEHHTEPLTQKQLRESTTILCSTRDRRRLGALEGAYIRHRNPDINRQYKFKVYLSLFNGPRLT